MRKYQFQTHTAQFDFRRGFASSASVALSFSPSGSHGQSLQGGNLRNCIYTISSVRVTAAAYCSSDVMCLGLKSTCTADSPWTYVMQQPHHVVTVHPHHS